MLCCLHFHFFAPCLLPAELQLLGFEHLEEGKTLLLVCTLLIKGITPITPR